MYSPLIIDKRLYAAKKNGLKFERRSRDRSLEISAKLERLRYNGRDELLPEGQLSRPLDAREQDFIASEQILCRADFEYYLTRYHTIERDPGVGSEGGIGAAKLLESQIKFIRELGKREEVCHQEYKEYKHTDGILVYAHKCRQVAFTATSNAAVLQRMLLYPGTRAFTCALDNAGELYKRYKTAINGLPFWLRPPMPLYPDVKDREIGFTNPINSRLLIQEENQQHGIGTGTQQEVSHLTEVPLWKHPKQIGYSFVPAMPKGRMTFHIQEGTSAGPGDYWEEVTEACRRRDRGYESWIYIFVPWYLNTLKWRDNAPSNWIPREHTVQHAELIERTSPEFCDGKTFRPSRDQLYWWETTRIKYASQGELAQFLANWPATPEQSFVNWSEGALPVELVEQMEQETRRPVVYEVEVEHTPSSETVSSQPSDDGFPEALYVGGSSVRKYYGEAWEEIDRDPRGLLLMWSPPKEHAKYILGLDPTVGRTGWTRATKFEGDHKIDNAAFGVFEVDGVAEPLWKEENGVRIPDIDPVTKRRKFLYRDLQVAEFAAPCDAVEIARVVNIVGRIFKGDADEHCEMIYESHPGPGMLSTQEFLRLGYTNVWMWETFADGMAEPTQSMGWHSTPRSQQILWYRSRRHLMNRQAIIRSKWALSEFTKAVVDPERMRARAAYGSHDDRLQYCNMAFWAGHRWTQDSEATHEIVTTVPVVDFQRIAPTLGEHESYTDWRENATADWDD